MAETPRPSRCAEITVRYWFSMPVPVSAGSGHNSHRKPAVSTSSLTHLHMDHIQGLGFFGPLYNPQVDVHIWGPASSRLSLAGRLSRYLSPPLFPVHLRDLPRVTCQHVPCPA